MAEHSESFKKIVNEAKKQVVEINCQQLHQKMQDPQNFILLDVRENDEWANGHLPSAMHLPRGILEREIEHLVPNKEVSLVLYCAGGYRSALGCESLMKMGYKHVTSLKGGIKAWIHEQLPVCED